MKATDYAPRIPLEHEPAGEWVPPEQRIEALLDALTGVQLGKFDERIVRWLVRSCDDPTVRTVVSLLLRTRAAGALQAQRVEADRLLGDVATWLRGVTIDGRVDAIRHIEMARAALERANRPQDEGEAR